MTPLKHRVERFFRNPLGLERDAVLLEQLQLVAKNQSTGIVANFLLVGLLSWILWDELGGTTVGIWAALMIALLLIAGRHAGRNKASGIAIERARIVVLRLTIGGVLHGLLWGALGWLVLGHASEKHSFLVIAIIAGVSGGATVTLGPILLLQAAFLLPTFAILTARAWTLDGPSNFALGLTFVIYLGSLLLHGRSNAKATRANIDLLFENRHLLKQLREETQRAQEARMEAETANLAKSRFLAAASHDLRQPIHAQGLFLDVLSSTQLDSRQREMLNSTMAAREASSEMLNTLLDFSRIDAGVIVPQIQVFQVQPMLNKIEREFSQQADANGLDYRSRESKLAVRSDPQLVELILRNLVSNAIKYTRRGGLLVNFRRRGASGVFEVWDTGAGIETSQREAIFREFYQLGNPERDRNKGLGLGLAIVQGLTRALGIRLSLDSMVGRGSVFRVELPLAVDAMPDVAGVLGHREPALPQARVLVLDDDPVICKGMVQLLNAWGCVCEAAQSIEMALAMAQRFQPDVLISDFRLRGHQTGIEAIAALRQSLAVPLPALLITGDTGAERLRETQASGIPVLHKPVSSSQLFQALIAVLPSM